MTPTPSDRKRVLKGIKKTKELNPKKDIICDDCILGHWVTDKDWNYSIEDHKPLTIRCPHQEYGINRGTKACIYFKAKE